MCFTVVLTATSGAANNVHKALVAKVQQLEQLVQNNQAVNNRRQEDSIEFRAATSVLN